MHARTSEKANLAEAPIEPGEVRAALSEILQSEAFSSSKRCCDFLSYVVEHTLTGQRQELKERTIAVAVFGRDPSYDSHEDAIVRIKASEVRKRLGHYYAGEGKRALIHISLPRGGYVPIFGRPEVNGGSSTNGALGNHSTEAAERDSTESGADSIPSKREKSRLKTTVGLIFSAVLVLLLALGAILFLPRPKPTEIDEFWGPALNAAEPIYLVSAAAPVYVSYGNGAKPEYVATTDQFVGQGDMLASHRIAAMMERRHQPYEVKVSNEVDVRELPKHTVVLIGYSSTQWDSISKGLRYYIDSERAGVITDNGKDTEWYPRNLTKDLHAEEDYAILSRFLDPDTRSMVVLVSGGTQYGTEGAAMLATEEELLRNALRGAPTGWQKKNLQVVIHMKVISNSPATPEVVATYFW